MLQRIALVVCLLSASVWAQSGSGQAGGGGGSSSNSSSSSSSCLPDPVLGGLSYAFGAGVGDYGTLPNGTEATFTVATGLDGCCCAPSPCLDLARIRVTITGPDGRLVGHRFAAPCVRGEYAVAWTPCQPGWHVVSVAIDAQSVRNLPATLLVDGPSRTTYVLAEDAGASASFDFNGLLRNA